MNYAITNPCTVLALHIIEYNARLEITMGMELHAICHEGANNEAEL